MKNLIRILLVDDNEDDYLITDDLLQSIEGQAFELQWSATYSEALLAINRREHDVYLIDYRLGVDNGLKLLHEAINSGCTAPLILLTGQDDHEVDLLAMQAGAADYLVKDQLNAPLLERSMRYALTQKQTEKALRESEERFRRLAETLEQKVAERTNELQEALKTLQSTQDQLIEAEKMAALGNLVAGVAHEINTPVGLGVTVASDLETETKSFIMAYKKGKLTQSGLKKYLNRAMRSSQLILDNLEWAAELVQSFKQVAVDQTSLEKRPVLVKSYLEETILSLTPELKRTKHTLSIEGDETISLNSYPGALSQVITNLVMNSITHAYQEGEVGHLNLKVTQQPEHVRIAYSDDGCGIPPEHLPKIFDPFFTTARNRGGSGLGLHIVYNLVSQTLKGSIHCESQVGVGSNFIIQLPLEVN